MECLLPSDFEVRPVRGSHRKACSECGHNSWFEGEYYVYNARQPFDTEKYCLDCAEDVFDACHQDDVEDDESSSDEDDEDDEDEELTFPVEDPPVKDSDRSSAGWQLWPKVKRGRYGLVFVVSRQKFGYYDDDETPECIVYFGMPLLGQCYGFRRSDLRQPPFEGEFRAM